MAVGTLKNEGDLKRWLERELAHTVAAPKGPQIRGMIVPEDYIAPTFTNSWVNYGSTFATAAYMRDRMGFVHLRGTVKSGTAGSSIFTLPAGYRPAADLIFPIAAALGTSYLTLATAGTVTPAAGAGNAIVSVDGITFRAEA